MFSLTQRLNYVLMNSILKLLYLNLLHFQKKYLMILFIIFNTQHFLDIFYELFFHFRFINILHRVIVHN